MRKLFTVLVLSLSLSGCATLDFLNPNAKSILAGGTSITATIGQPITQQDMFVIESAYQAGLITVANYRRFCYSAPLSTLPGFCKNRRQVMLIAQTAVGKARIVMKSLRFFVDNNDTVNAINTFNAAKQVLVEVTQSIAVQGVN